MSDITDKDLEKAMQKAMAALRDMENKEREKQFKKHWSGINVPFTLDEGLNRFKKYELDHIRKNLNLPNASHLKKGELIARLQESIPGYLEALCLLWDAERFALLTKIAAKGGHIVAPDIEPAQIDYFRERGLIYTGVFEGKKVLAVPHDLIEQILAMDNNEKVKEQIKRNTEWILLTRGLLYYYGTLSLVQLENFIESYMKEKIQLREYINVIHDANEYQKEIHINADGYSNIRVFDPKRVKQEHKSRKSLQFYPFTKQQLLTAGKPDFVERNKSYIQLVNYLTQNYEINKKDADGIVEECVYATRIGESPNAIMQFLSQQLEFQSMEDFQALMERVVHLMNNTREWFLKGYTSAELRKLEKEHLQPLPTSGLNKKVAKIGRNDSCPCGSGKKYKKCCGAN